MEPRLGTNFYAFWLKDAFKDRILNFRNWKKSVDKKQHITELLK